MPRCSCACLRIFIHEIDAGKPPLIRLQRIAKFVASVAAPTIRRARGEIRIEALWARFSRAVMNGAIRSTGRRFSSKVLARLETHRTE